MIKLRGGLGKLDGKSTLMRLCPLRDMVGGLPITLLRLSGGGGAEGLSLLEALGRGRSELLGWQHGGAQPIVCLWKSAGGGWELSPELRKGGALVLVLRHEHVSHAVLGCNVVMELLVEHDRRGVQVRVEALVLRR